MKSISTIIASLLILVIVIGLASTSYLFISGVFTGKISTAFEVVNTVDDTVTIKNIGIEPIKSMTATLDGNPVTTIFKLNDNLAAYWKMNDGSGTKATDSSRSNIGTLYSGAIECSDPPTVGCPKWVDGKFGKALRFDGSDSVTVGNDPSLNPANAYTVEAWVNFDSASKGLGARRVVGKNDGFSGYLFQGWSNDYIYFYVSVNGNLYAISQAFPFAHDQWTHVVMTAETISGITYGKYYINGTIYGQPSASGSITHSSGSLLIGFDSFNGVVDEVRIYNKALAQKEVEALYLANGEIILEPGKMVTIKPITTAPLTKGTHTLKLCTSSMCNTAYLTIN